MLIPILTSKIQISKYFDRTGLKMIYEKPKILAFSPKVAILQGVGPFSARGKKPLFDWHILEQNAVWYRF